MNNKKKKKIAIITRRFFPHGDATSEIINNISSELLLDNYQVDIFALTDYKEDLQIKNVNGMNVFFLYVPETKNLAEIQKSDLSLWYKTTLIFKKTIAAFAKKTVNHYRIFSLNPFLVNAYKKIINNYFVDHDYDFIIITMMPHEAVWAYLNSDKAFPFFLYQLDTYWNNEVYPIKYKEQRWAFEKEAIEESVSAIVTPIIYNLDLKKDEMLLDKMIQAEFPLIAKPKKTMTNKKEDKNIHFSFAGSFYADIRPPEKMVEFISKLNNDNYCFDFYGSNQELICKSSCYDEAKKRMNLFGQISSKIVNDKLNCSDFLVNLDNNNINQVPSKIFNYICTGKPIINFYFLEQSPTLEYLSNYPLCLNINLNQEINDETILSFEKYVDKTKFNVSFDEIRNIYEKCTPRYVYEKIMMPLFKNRI